MFSQNKKHRTEEIYPHVFDSKATATQSAAFVGGTKVAFEVF